MLVNVTPRTGHVKISMRVVARSKAKAVAVAHQKAVEGVAAPRGGAPCKVRAKPPEVEGLEPIHGQTHMFS
jgi:hypothetical protein